MCDSNCLEEVKKITGKANENPALLDGSQDSPFTGVTGTSNSSSPNVRQQLLAMELKNRRY